MTACMGGWCAAKRDKCTHYVLPPHPARKNPAERLCGPGMADAFVPITPFVGETIMRKSRTSIEESRAAVLAAIPVAGASAAELHKVLGFSHLPNSYELLREMVKDGLIFNCRMVPVGTNAAEQYYFLNAEACSQAFAAYKLEAEARAKQGERERYTRRLIAQKEQRAIVRAKRKEAKAAEKLAREQAKAELIAKGLAARAAWEAERKHERELRATARAEQAAAKAAALAARKSKPLPKVRPVCARQSDASHRMDMSRARDRAAYRPPAVDAPVIIPSHVRVQVCPSQPDRFAINGPVIGGFGSEGPGRYIAEAASCAARAYT